MRYTKTVVASYPAYDVILPRKATLFDYPEFKAGAEIAVMFSGGRNYKMFTIGSVVSYALESTEDPIEAYKECIARGDEAYWLNANCVSITSNNEAKKEYFLVEIGEEILFEGIIFRVEPASNNNLSLVKVGSCKAIMDARWNGN